MDFKARASIALFGYVISAASKHERNTVKNVAQALREAYDQGRRDENEACAKVCESRFFYGGSIDNEPVSEMAFKSWQKKIAQMVRQRIPNASAEDGK